MNKDDKEFIEKLDLIKCDSKIMSEIELLNFVKDNMDYAKEYGLEAEVFLVALKYMKDNPTASIEEAVYVGLIEWDL